MQRPSHNSRHIADAALALALTFAAASACSGRAFSPSDEPCSGSACDEEEPQAGSGGTGVPPASGGKAGGAGKAGDAGEAGTSGGHAGAGGTAGTAGGGLPTVGGSAPLAGSGGVGNTSGGSSSGAGTGGKPDEQPHPFPATGVLDDFNRDNLGLGASWVGEADNYSLEDQALWCEVCASAALWSTPFDGEQEVHATLKSFDADAGEINLVLKAQDEAGCELLEVLFSPARAEATVAFCTGGVWTDNGTTPLVIKPGDRVGGRSLSNGFVEIYLNGQLVTTVDASDFPYSSGRIGVDGVSGSDGLTWDDFGGGEWR